MQTIAATRDELDRALGRHGLALGDQGADGRGRESHAGTTTAHPGARRASSAGPEPEPEPTHPAHARDPHLRARA